MIQHAHELDILVAPNLFHSLAEHPLELLLLVVFIPTDASSQRNFRWEAGIIAFAMFLVATYRESGLEAAAMESMLFFGSFGMVLAVGATRRLPYAVAVGAPLAFLASFVGTLLVS